MNLRLRNSTVFPMFELCKKHKNGLLKREELEEMLNHEDYQVEFQRYGQEGLPICTISREEFVDYFMNIFDVKEEDIKNERLRIHHDSYIKFFDNIDEIERKTVELFNTVSEQTIYRGLQYTNNGLPDSEQIDNLDILFTISIGNSFGWPYENCTHYDIVNYFNYMSGESFEHIIGHEVHHILLDRLENRLYPDNNLLSKESNFYLYFSFEGLAVKYCNNMEGLLTENMYKNEPANIGMDARTWEYFANTFDEMFIKLKKDIYDMRAGKLTDEQFQELILNYWQAISYFDDGSRLNHSRNYYMGASIWGIIQDVFGKDKVYEVIANIELFPEVYNQAVKAKGLDPKYLI